MIDSRRLKLTHTQLKQIADAIDEGIGDSQGNRDSIRIATIDLHAVAHRFLELSVKTNTPPGAA